MIYIAISIIGIVIGCAIGGAITVNLYEKHISTVNKDVAKYAGLYGILFQWVRLVIDGRDIISYFQKNNYMNVAVYGMGELGYLFADKLKSSDVTVLYCIDRNADNMFSKYTIYKPEDELPEVDLVVVSTVQYYEEIKANLEGKLNCPIISIEDVVWEA